MLTLKINWYEEEPFYRTTDFQDFRIAESGQNCGTDLSRTRHFQRNFFYRW
ncbi:Uncharacterised protein [Weeksella virosa]|uniref:Uncharacterized protein n=1 Tax=Weeksella virosa (strain ATCC 43766 / DSM 16922 / JCM 21250 / CCUG 30538 / CDC 9751 / IAM 14551 / NBRC 16016 / NCTC 11634 / CL345/78) TaxID=865938 RepID=F0NXE1_WEEVC|nr:hypothetical protein Weevi_0191 [Weeksella virosa DSM 16922]SUP53227.1 Uncharacterised protein [Weeksella virosa]VEH63358.1 Uncharacterised protein [Weeksella virosa]